MEKEKLLFTAGYGIENCENKIGEIATKDHIHAVILAAVHFEWVIKRAILKLGHSPTVGLREQLESVWEIDKYKDIWKQEVVVQYKNSALGTVLGNLPRIKNQALKVRGKIVHGNGTVSKKEADEAICHFLRASKKLREFATSKNIDLDSRLKVRRSKR